MHLGRFEWLAAGALALLLAAGLAVSWFVGPRPTAAHRGAVLYSQLGCGGCHGAAGVGGIANPKSKEREVPGFIGGTAMMYVESVAEIRQWILDGRPGRLKASPAGDDALVTMPAYRGRLSDNELDDLVAYYQALAWYEPGMPEEAELGRRVAAKKGCFGCHGASGRVGVANPGSFKGYVPGWGSDDFFELVRDEQELREWITDGVSKRFRDNALAQFFLQRQVVRMPAYGELLSTEELEAIVTYTRWLARDGWAKP